MNAADDPEHKSAETPTARQANARYVAVAIAP
jgi:hypothetical protein